FLLLFGVNGMKAAKGLVIAALVTGVLHGFTAGSGGAASFSWVNPAVNGAWSSVGSWNNGSAVPNAPGDVANITHNKGTHTLTPPPPPSPASSPRARSTAAAS